MWLINHRFVRIKSMSPEWGVRFWGKTCEKRKTEVQTTEQTPQTSPFVMVGLDPTIHNARRDGPSGQARGWRRRVRQGLSAASPKAMPICRLWIWAVL